MKRYKRRAKEPLTVTATEASRAFSEMLHRVCYGGESFIIKKGQKLMARIVPMGAVADAPELVAEPAQESVCAEAAAPLQSLTTANSANNAHDLTGLTQEEADYYQTVVEQLRRTVIEPCDN